MSSPVTTFQGAAGLYLDLLKGCLTRELFRDSSAEIAPTRANRVRSRLGLAPRLQHSAFDPEARAVGRDRPTEAETMIGRARLDHLQHCITDVLAEGVPGDLIETGVWRGGATIFMRAVLAAYGDRSRTVWVADSFRGLPKPDADRYPADAGDIHWTLSDLAVDVSQVQANFARYGLLDDQVRFLEGWFSETLPSAPIDKLAVVRLDGDMYESTMDALTHLYPRLSVGGYLIVDDYGAIPGCRAAVTDFRARLGIGDEIRAIDWTGVYWRRER
jgi:O-methyltransferase